MERRAGRRPVWKSGGPLGARPALEARRASARRGRRRGAPRWRHFKHGSWRNGTNFNDFYRHLRVVVAPARRSRRSLTTKQFGRVTQQSPAVSEWRATHVARALASVHRYAGPAVTRARMGSTRRIFLEGLRKTLPLRSGRARDSLPPKRAKRWLGGCRRRREQLFALRCCRSVVVVFGGSGRGAGRVHFRVWPSLVGRPVRVGEVGGSNPSTRTACTPEGLARRRSVLPRCASGMQLRCRRGETGSIPVRGAP